MDWVKENQLIQDHNNQGITKNYPQQGTNFWGGSDNNYGFGSSNIHDNIENREKLLQSAKKQGVVQETSWPDKLRNEASKFGKAFVKSVTSDLADMGYGAKKALKGSTLGGSDWLFRRLGLDNENEYLAQKDAEGTGTAARVSGVISEIGGSLFGVGGGIAKGLGQLGLKGVKLAGASGLVEGMITGATNSDTWSELPKNMLLGSALGGIGGAAGQKVLDWVIKPFSSKAATYGMKGGMKNVVANPEASSFVKKGIKQSDELAAQALSQIPQTAQSLNSQTADMLQQSLGHKINLPQTIAAQKTKTEQYVLQHADDEVLDFAPTREQLIRYPAESKFNLPKQILKSNEIEDILHNKAQRSGIEIAGDINHYLTKRGRGQYARTLSNTLNNADIVYSQKLQNSKGDNVIRDYFVKKYKSVLPEGEKAFFDFVVQENGKLYNKFIPESMNYIDNQLQKATQNMSLRGNLSGVEGTYPPAEIVKNIPYRNIVVNRSLPNVSEVYNGLSDGAVVEMQQALSQGLDKTTQKAGSLESVYRIKNELDDMALAAKNSHAANYASLEQAQNNYSKLYARALQGQDKGFNLEQAYRAGLNNQAEALPTMSPLEKNAFSQGLFTQIKQNNGVNQNMAASALDYRSSLANALRPNNFNQLEYGLGQNAAQFNRLSEIGNVAESRLNLPQNQRLWGQGDVQASPETSSFGQALGQIKDKLQGNTLKNSTQNLLNPNFVGTQNNMLLGIYPNIGGVIPAQLYFENK